VFFSLHLSLPPFLFAFRSHNLIVGFHTAAAAAAVAAAVSTH
jgi:hypothetical protein